MPPAVPFQPLQGPRFNLMLHPTLPLVSTDSGRRDFSDRLFTFLGEGVLASPPGFECEAKCGQDVCLLGQVS